MQPTVGVGDSLKHGNLQALYQQLKNAQVAYSYFYEGDTSGNADIIPVESGTTSIQIDQYVSSKKAGYVVFFVKPDEDYLLTGLGLPVMAIYMPYKNKLW